MKNQRNRSIILIVGLGSIGKTHLIFALKNFGEVYIVDPSEHVMRYIYDHPESDRMKYFAKLEALPIGSSFDLTVIANWGPDHAATLRQLVTLGNQNYIVEKPLTSRIKDLLEMKDLVSNQEVKIVCNLTWSYSHFFEKVKEIEKKYDLGKVQNILVSGGAKCLVTNGIHYVGLALHIFEESPEEVFALTHNSEINPRSPKLLFLDGSSTWGFSGNRYLNISFSNNSHLQLSAVLNYSTARLVIEGNHATLYKITKENVSKIDKPTRTFLATEKINEFNPFIGSDGSDGTSNIYKKFLSGEDWDDFKHGEQATEAIFGMLISSQTGTKISLPLSEENIITYQNHEWNIS